MSSVSFSPAGLFAAMQTSDELHAGVTRWESANAIAQNWISLLGWEVKEQIIRLSEVKALASRDAGMLNSFIQDCGGKLIIPELMPDQLAMASFLNLQYGWSGEVQEILSPKYPAFYLDNATVFKFKNSPYWVSKVYATAVGEKIDIVYFIHTGRLDNPLEQFFNLSQLLVLEKENVNDYNALVCPMTVLKSAPPMEWMLETQGRVVGFNPFKIIKAEQQNSSAMDHLGGGIISETSLVGQYESMSYPYTINSPFVRIYTRPGVSVPLEITYFEEDSWRQPERDAVGKLVL